MTSSDTSHPPRSYLVTGGSGSGKSDFAQRLAARCGQPVTYLATGKAEGAEMTWRVRKHQASRPPSWRTVEASRSLAAALDAAGDPAPVVLLEDIGSLATACLPWIETQEGEMTFPQAALQAAIDDLSQEIDAVFAWCAVREKSLVLVTSEVGLGLLPPSSVGRLYKDAIGATNQALAARVDAAYLVVAGLPINLSAAARSVAQDLDLPPVETAEG